MLRSFTKEWKSRNPSSTTGSHSKPSLHAIDEAAAAGVKLIIILDLYFQLTPITMVPETPEIIDLAKLIKTTPDTIVEAMNVYQICDPYLNRNDVVISKLIDACSEIWQRYGNGNPDKLYKLANDLKEYFK